VISSLGTFHVSLTDFEGPLPLLLHLIEKNELEVTRVSIAAVADQFIALVASTGDTDLSATSEFVAVAARLLLIKSRALLFRSDGSEMPGENQDDAALLALQIAEYARYKAAGQAIAGLLAGDTWTRPRPEVVGVRVPPRAPTVHLDRVARAARRLLMRGDPLAEDVAHWPEVIYAAVRNELLSDVRRLKTTTFSALCKPEWHPLVIVTMFLAVLDAVRVEQLELRQLVAFGPIELTVPTSDSAYA
jgi:segregation and condensation protein A